jgi:hypothetical protein
MKPHPPQKLVMILSIGTFNTKRTLLLNEFLFIRKEEWFLMDTRALVASGSW